MARKFIPNSDQAFAEMAFAFAGTIARDPGRFEVSQADSEALSAAAAAYRTRLQAARAPGTRGLLATHRKTEARAAAERIIRRLAHVIRASETVDAVAKTELGLRERPAKARVAALPDKPPELLFVRALHESNGASPRHELYFQARGATSQARPAGAARIELFVDLVPPDEAIPAHPGANLGGRPWYLRSYTRNPIILTPPMPRVPMRVVYWARWADSAGNVGPFSATAVGWIEGGSHHLLPGGAWNVKDRSLLIEDTEGRGPAGRDEMIMVTVLEAQYDSLHRAAASHRLPGETPEPRRLEGPRQEPEEAAQAA